MKRTTRLFSDTLLNWYNKHGRKHLPWQQPRSGYRVWLSEIMLQQTQVKTVIPYFNRFIERFPDIETLATSTEDEIFSYWSGLGYYARARHLHKTAKIIHNQFQGVFPEELEALKTLPGIGPSTAAAIASIVYNQPTAILDGNVRRVLSRYFLVDGVPETAAVKHRLWQLANACMPSARCAEYTQAIMDLGALCCTNTKPTCTACPLQNTCQAYLKNLVNLYPQKKIKKVIPTRHEQFLLFYTIHKHIYLEKRPARGIWAGLWCLPAIADDQDAKTHAERHYPIRVEQITPIMELQHTLTHVHFSIRAVGLQSSVTEQQVMTSEGRWFSVDEIRAVGIAKPVDTIIQQFLCLFTTNLDAR